MPENVEPFALARSGPHRLQVRLDRTVKSGAGLWVAPVNRAAGSIYSALKVRGVPVALLQFEGEYHGTVSKPSNFIRTQLYMMSWFKRYTRSPEGRSTYVSVAPAEQ